MSGQSNEFDVVIIGAGPAGLTAAIYSSWLGLGTVVLEARARAGSKGKNDDYQNSFEEIVMYALEAGCHVMWSFVNSACRILCKTRMYGV